MFVENTQISIGEHRWRMGSKRRRRKRKKGGRGGGEGIG